MNSTQLMAAVVGAGQGKSDLDAPQPYRVTMMDDTQVMVFAHTYAILDGCLQFIVMKAKDVLVGDPPEKRTAVFQTFPKTIAAGVWISVEEVFLPSVWDNTKAN